MTKGPQPTTHNAERGARNTCREKSETGSSLKRSEKRKHVALRSKNVWRFGEIVFGDLEKLCSAIWRNCVRRFGENVLGDFVLELVMEYRSARRPYVEIKT